MTDVNNEEMAAKDKAQLEDLGLLLEQCSEEVSGWTPPANDFSVCGLVRSLVGHLQNQVDIMATDMKLVRQALSNFAPPDRLPWDSIIELDGARRALVADRDDARKELQDILVLVGWHNVAGEPPVAAVNRLVKRHAEQLDKAAATEKEAREAKHKALTTAEECARLEKALEAANVQIGNLVDERNVLKQAATGVAEALQCHVEDIDETARNVVARRDHLQSTVERLENDLATTIEAAKRLDVEQAGRTRKAWERADELRDKLSKRITEAAAMREQLKRVEELLRVEIKGAAAYRKAVMDTLLFDTSAG